MRFQRISSYKVMVVIVLFDLPVETKDERRKASRFRTNLKKLGFRMLQYSTYVKLCFSYEDTQAEISHIESILEDKGEVGILITTEKQYNSMKYYSNKTINGKKLEIKNEQLRLF